MGIADGTAIYIVWDADLISETICAKAPSYMVTLISFNHNKFKKEFSKLTKAKYDINRLEIFDCYNNHTKLLKYTEGI